MLIGDGTVVGNFVDSVGNAAYLGAYMTVSAGVVVVLVGISKYIPGLKDQKSGVIQLVLTVGLWIIFVAVERAGYRQQIELTFQFIETVGQALLGVLGTAIGSSAAYHTARRNRVPVVGMSKTPYE